MQTIKRISFGLILTLLTSLSFAEDTLQTVIGPFGLLNDYDHPISIASDKAQDLLNVDVSPNGKSVKKRKGYGTAFTLTNSTSATHGLHKFYDATGNEIVLVANDTYLSASINGATPSVLFSTGPNGVTYQCVDSQGYAYCNNTSRNSLIRTNGLTYNEITNTNSTGTMVAVTPDRLATSGFSDNPNRIDFSAAADFTSWTAPFSDDNDPNQITITAPGSKITHITYAFGQLIWFKDNSFGSVLFGETLSDWQVRTISPNIGTLDNSSTYWNDVLYFRGQDGHYYSYDGANIQLLSRDITNTVSSIQQRISNSWVQTSQSDFEAGSITPMGSLSSTVTVNSLTLSTDTAISPFVDTTGDNFAAGSLTNLSTSSVEGSLTLSFGSESTLDQHYGPDGVGFLNTCGSSGGGGWAANKLIAGSTYYLSSVGLRLSKAGSPGSHILDLMTNSSGSPGTILSSVTFSVSSVGSSGTDLTVNFVQPYSLLSQGTTYWLRIRPPSDCSNGDTPARITWLMGSVTASTHSYCTNNGSSNSCSSGSESAKFKSNGRTYNTSGNIVSRTFDVGITTNSWIWDWSTFSANGSIASDSTLAYETQTSADGSNWDSLVSVSSGNAPSSIVRRYIRYKASFTTTNVSTTPVLADVTINMTSRLKPGGTFYSVVRNAPNLTSWDSFTASIVNSTSSHSFSIRASTNPFAILSSTPTWVSILSGGIPQTSTGTYFQVRDIVTTTTTVNGNPTLNDFTVNWFEGQASDKVYSGYFDNSVWWNVQFGTSSSYNNRVVKYDLLNNGFTIYEMPMNGFFIKNNSLYFGGSNTGKIFKFGDVENDDGSPIVAYWKSKDFFGDSPFTDKSLATISIAASSVINSSMTVTYTVNGTNETSFVMPLYRSTNIYSRLNKNLPSSNATIFNVKFGNDADDQPFEVFGVQVGYRPKSWIPTP